MYAWEIEFIKKDRGIPVIRIDAKTQEVNRYKSIHKAARANNTYDKKIKKTIEEGSELNGYFYDYN